MTGIKPKIKSPLIKNGLGDLVLDVKKIRGDFPILSRKVYGKPLIYLDNAATSQKPRSVINALTEYYEQYNSNVHRGVHALSMEATERYDGAREKIANFIGSPSSENIIFTRNTTEAINLVAYTWGKENISDGDEILLTRMEHHSNLVPWQRLAKENGAKLKFIPLTEEATLDLTNLGELITSRTKLVAITHMSNVLGTINPINKIISVAHDKGALVLVDGAQSVPHLPINVSEINCDFFAFSSHKMLGPTGVGVLFGKTDLLESIEPFLSGGEMVREVWYDHATWNEIPYRFEAGTPDIADAIALGAAVEYLEWLGMDNVRRHEMELTQYALDAFDELDEIKVFGPRDVAVRGGILSFHSEVVHPHDLGTILDRDGIAVRAGHHCAMPLMRSLGLIATARASFYVYNYEEEIDHLISSLKKAIRYFGDGIRSVR